MKKLLALILALSMAFTMTACDGDKTAESTGGEAGQPQQTETDKKEETKKDYNIPEFDESKRISDVEIIKLKLDKKAYAVGEEISFILEWKGTADSSAWVGIVPAEVPHGDELVNDDYDLWYTYLEMLNSGEEFMAIIDLEPGRYTMRVNEYDDGGPELAWVEFTVGGDKVQEQSKPFEGEINFEDAENFMNIIWADQDEVTKQALIASAAEDGTKITFPSDGTMRVEEADGTVTIQHPDGSWSVDGEDISADGKWPSNEYTKLVPKPDMEINVTATNDSEFAANFKNATKDDIKAYAQKIKDKGFDKDVEEQDLDMGDMKIYNYKASNGNGYVAEVSFAMGVSGLKIAKE